MGPYRSYFECRDQHIRVFLGRAGEAKCSTASTGPSTCNWEHIIFDKTESFMSKQIGDIVWMASVEVIHAYDTVPIFTSSSQRRLAKKPAPPAINTRMILFPSVKILELADVRDWIS